ncbi:hypothetical protein WICPIJ_009117 [Wickerhamomyces pijperi]|uniref:Uncharacterized protein n=1 Tax=Wickerhamomyces pijperi TaxID=599730 RepID=A0A9P8TFH7_WICPI|nr:hypothetical protein WICPIJ_009117 [Wickerhamomyces pijperi]
MYSQHHPELEKIKICVLGQVGAGKSALTLQFAQQYFPIDYDENIEDTYIKKVHMNEKLYEYHILDTALQEDYSPLKDLQYTEADGFIIVFGIDSLDSFQAVKNEYSHIFRVRKETPPILLVGNKVDLETDRQVEPNEAERVVEQLGFIKYSETSAKNNFNVNESFLFMGDQILKNKQEIKEKMEKFNGISNINAKDIHIDNSSSTFTTNSNLDRVISHRERRRSQAQLESMQGLKSNKSPTLRDDSIAENTHKTLGSTQHTGSPGSPTQDNTLHESTTFSSTKNNFHNEQGTISQNNQASVSSNSKGIPIDRRSNISSENGTVEKTSSKCCVIM